MSKKEYDEQACVEKFDRIIDAYHAINTKDHLVTILTGKNGSGKSFLRKQLSFRIKEETSENSRLIHTSMDLRTGSNPELGALSAIFRDLPWLATSYNTKNSIEKTISHAVGNFYCIDEPEIGLGEEGQLAISKLLNEKIATIKNDCLGILIITHSRIVVQNLLHDAFVNIEGMSEKEWLNREISQLDLDELERNELFFYIRDQESE